MRQRQLPLTKLLKIKSFGNSMYPLLHDGDIIYLKRIRFTSIKINDIVCFKKKNTLISHRVIYKTHQYVITKGDNTETSDGRIYPKAIVGKVQAFMRDGDRLPIDIMYLKQSSLYFSEIQIVTKKLKKQGIDFVYLKGLPYHLVYEKTHPRRFYADCDILIQKKQYREVITIFKNLGYVQLPGELSHTQAIIKDKEIEVSWYKASHGFYITFDIHLEPAFLMTQLGTLNALYPQKLINAFTNEIFQEKRYIQLKENKYPILSPQDTILYLSLHFFHHNFTDIHRLDFLNTVLTHPSSANVLTSPQALASKIQTLRLTTFVYPVFLLLQKYYPNIRYIAFIRLLRANLTQQQATAIHRMQITNRVFESESRMNAGVKRFSLIFQLSPNHLLQKLFIFIHPPVLFSLLWVSFHSLKQLGNRMLKVNVIFL